MKHSMPGLPYAMEALAPYMSQETMEYHYGKHLQTYVDNLNKLVAGTPFERMTLDDIVCRADGAIFNNAAQTWNHTFFFDTLTPRQTDMPDKLVRKLTENFGSPEAFRQEFTQKAVSWFGSGWVWLAEDADKMLHVVAEPNAGNPITLIIVTGGPPLSRLSGIWWIGRRWLHGFLKSDKLLSRLY